MDTDNIEDTLKYYTKWKQKDYVICDSIYMNFKGRQNYSNRNTSGFLGPDMGRGINSKGTQKIFSEWEK